MPLAQIAAAAMEAAESAVRDEMECIAVVKDTEEGEHEMALRPGLFRLEVVSRGVFAQL